MRGCCSDRIRLHSLLIESREYQAIMLLHQDGPQILRRKKTCSLNPAWQFICFDFSRFLIEIQVDNNWSCINRPLHHFLIRSSQIKETLNLQGQFILKSQSGSRSKSFKISNFEHVACQRKRAV